MIFESIYYNYINCVIFGKDDELLTADLEEKYDEIYFINDHYTNAILNDGHKNNFVYDNINYYVLCKGKNNKWNLIYTEYSKNMSKVTIDDIKNKILLQ